MDKDILARLRAIGRQATINANANTDEQALEVKEIYPSWEDFIGQALKKGKRVLYESRLYKVRQDISVVLENQPPSISTAALYEEIVEDHAGTADDPIPYNGNMEIFKDKYYTQDDILYKCTRDSGQPLTHALSELVGIYVEVVK